MYLLDMIKIEVYIKNLDLTHAEFKIKINNETYIILYLKVEIKTSI